MYIFNYTTKTHTIMSTTDLLPDSVQDYTPADKGLRFANLIIDTIGFYGLIFLMGMLLALTAPEMFADENDVSASLTLNLFALVIYILYFMLLEGLFKGKTLGKLITGTRAVKEDGSSITMGDAFKRALSRLVPFEPFSALGDRPWHDKWTDTVVVKEYKS